MQSQNQINLKAGPPAQLLMRHRQIAFRVFCWALAAYWIPKLADIRTGQLFDLGWVALLPIAMCVTGIARAKDQIAKRIFIWIIFPAFVCFGFKAVAVQNGSHFLHQPDQAALSRFTIASAGYLTFVILWSVLFPMEACNGWLRTEPVRKYLRIFIIGCGLVLIGVIVVQLTLDLQSFTDTPLTITIFLIERKIHEFGIWVAEFVLARMMLPQLIDAGQARLTGLVPPLPRRPL